jgi:hypothetical protein
MPETGFTTSQAVTAEQKQAALEAVLHSQTFARADQLKSFLKYVCEREIEGHGHELTEYLIGVEALGRPANYSPGDDSAVRNRAYALRKKLQEFYETEQTDALLRIELTKGSYCPHFIERPLHTAPTTNGHGGAAQPGLTPLAPAVLNSFKTFPAESLAQPVPLKPLTAFLAGVIITALLAGSIYLLTKSKLAQPGLPPILLEAWGPLLEPGADVLLCVANPPSFSVHPSPVSAQVPATTPVNPPAVAPKSFYDPGARALPVELHEMYRARFPATADHNLFLTITTNATYWGDSLGALTAHKTLLTAGAAAQLYPEKVITVPTLRRRNVLLLGAPEYSPAITYFLEKCPLTVNYLDDIASQEPGQAPQQLYTVKRDQQNRMTQVYGLITVLPSESTSNQPKRTIIFSGINSAGTQAAAEFFTSPEHLAELKKQLKKAGHQSFPSAYQVVVRSETEDSILLNFHYETYRLIPAQVSQ